MNLGKRLEEAIQYSGEPSRRQFALKIGMDPGQLRRILIGENPSISRNMAKKIGEVYNISADWLLDGVGEMSITESQKKTPPKGEALIDAGASIIKVEAMCGVILSALADVLASQQGRTSAAVREELEDVVRLRTDALVRVQSKL